MRARNTVILECQQFKIPQDHETCYKSTSWRVERAFFGPEAAYARGRLVSLEGFSIAFCAKNGEWRDSHLGFQVSFASPWLQWRNVLIPLRPKLLNVYVYLHHRRSKFVNSDFRRKLTTSGGRKKQKLVSISSQYWERRSPVTVFKVIFCVVTALTRTKSLFGSFTEWEKASNRRGRPLQRKKEA